MHYFIIMKAGHAGTEHWQAGVPRLKFPLPPDQMDAHAAAAEAGWCKLQTVLTGWVAALESKHISHVKLRDRPTNVCVY